MTIPQFDKASYMFRAVSTHQRYVYWAIILIVCLPLILLACGNGNNITPPQQTSCPIATPVAAPISTTASVSTNISLPGHPFASITTQNGQWLFVSLNTVGIAVLHKDGQQFRLTRVVLLTSNVYGMALTTNNTMLLVADGNGVTFVSVLLAENGGQNAVLGNVQVNGDAGTIEVTVAKDGRYAFTTDENSASISVIDLQRIRANNFSSSAIAGTIPVDIAPVGMAISPDNHYLYVTSEISTQAAKQSGFNPAQQQVPGTLSIVDVAKAEHDPAHAIITRVPAGCSPVRVILSSAGNIAWVTARASNMLLAFNTSRLLTDPRHALLASLPVGTAPVGVALLNNDSIIAVANSNRFAQDQTPQTVMLLDTQKALAGHTAILKTIRVGIFPRELSTTPDGQTLFVTNYNSNTLTIINVAGLHT